MTRTLLALLLVLPLAACGDDGGGATDGGSKAGKTAKDAPQASAVRGGQLYDKFWAVAKLREPKGEHPFWAQRPDAASNKRTGATTWRCKECHGWDYKGVDGAYGSGSHKTGIAGVLGTKLGGEGLRAVLAEAHGYAEAGLKDVDLESLALFLAEGLVDTAAHIDAEGRFQGDAAKGKALYLKGLGGNKACASCHGPDGLKPPKGAPPGYEDFVGTVANKNPWEFLHKVRFGHPGAKMPAAHGSKASMQDIIDLSAFAQTLPKSE